MTIQTQDYTWEQGEDFTLSLTYTIDGAPIGAGYQVRMDIAPAAGTPTAPVYTAAMYSLNSDDIIDSTLDTTGTADNEITVDDQGNITITVPHSATLAGSPLGDSLMSGKSQYVYDVFVRDPSGKQTKALKGNIAINRSVTQWA